MPEDEERPDPRARANRTNTDRIEMLEHDTQGLAHNVGILLKREDSFSAAQIAQLRGLLREEFGNIGLRIDEDEHVDMAREDLRFLRRTRLKWDSAANKVGGAVLLAIVGIGLAIAGMGFWAWLSKGLGH